MIGYSKTQITSKQIEAIISAYLSNTKKIDYIGSW